MAFDSSVSDSLIGMEESDFEEKDPTGRYIRYGEVLGKGAFKTVYKAFDLFGGIEVAWNQIDIDEVVHSPQQMDQLVSEVNLLRSLKHDNIMKLHCSWFDDKHKNINMITELFTSGSLRQYRKKHKNVDIKAIKRWARQILQGLHYLHSHKQPIIHRDLKCDNIFVNGNNGKVKIGDLGFATVMQQPTEKSVIGTPEFMAPEIYDENYNELADIYSFGMCILEMVTGDYPYAECKNPAQIFKKVTTGVKPASLAKVIDPQAKQFIEKCLVPASMRSSAVELLEDPFLSSGSIKRPNDTTQQSLRSTPKSLKLEETLLQSNTTKGLNDVTQQLLDSIPKSMKLETPEALRMDIDNNCQKQSVNTCTRSSSLTSHRSSLELERYRENTQFRLQGQQTDDHTVSLTIRISGHRNKIDFLFYLDIDTSLSIATEMAEQLELANEEIAVIAELLEDLITKIVPDWKPSYEKHFYEGNSSGASSYQDCSVNVHDSVINNPTKESNYSDMSEVTCVNSRVPSDCSFNVHDGEINLPTNESNYSDIAEATCVNSRVPSDCCTGGCYEGPNSDKSDMSMSSSIELLSPEDKNDTCHLEHGDSFLALEDRDDLSLLPTVGDLDRKCSVYFFVIHSLKDRSTKVVLVNLLSRGMHAGKKVFFQAPTRRSVMRVRGRLYLLQDSFYQKAMDEL